MAGGNPVRGPSGMRTATARVIAVLAAILVFNSCTAPPKHAMPADPETIRVGRAEVFENADLQASLDAVKAQLASLTLVNGTSISGALSNVQGFSSRQSSVALQAMGSPLPQVVTTVPTGPGAQPATQTGTAVTTQAATTPAAPTLPTLNAPAAPTLAPAAANILDRQLQLSSQVSGYELLLTGSDFSRYTPSGAPKDRIVIGIPITIYPKEENHDQVAEVTIQYFPPNSIQYGDPQQFNTRDPWDPTTHSSCAQVKYSGARNPVITQRDGEEVRKAIVDQNGPGACYGQEQTTTIVNILPTERTYDTISATSRASSVGVGAIVGTINAGVSAGSSQQTQYLVAQQETVALAGVPSVRCPAPEKIKTEDVWPESPASAAVTCRERALGVEFKWQFRPVLGQHFVRTGERRVFVQLAIPYARRPYPHYGGVILVSRAWLPYDVDRGVITEHTPKSQAMPQLEARAVFGPPFYDAIVSDIVVRDVGGGLVQTDVTGRFLLNAKVRVGPSIQNSSSPGFAMSNNTLEFIATAQSLAQFGATILASGGVDTPLTARSLCKAADPFGECLAATEIDSEVQGGETPPKNPSDCKTTPPQIEVNKITLAPVSDSTSLVTVELKAKLKIESYPYYEYLRSPTDLPTGVIGIDTERKPDLTPKCLDHAALKGMNKLPVVIVAGGKTYGLSDLPFQSRGADKISFLASNDSLDAAPTLRVQRLFGDPKLDSEPVQFTSPSRLRSETRDVMVH